MSRTREIIVQLLQNVAGRKEVAEYLRHYTNVDAQRGLVVSFARDLDIASQAEPIAEALSFLHEVGVRAVVLATGREAVLAIAEALEQRECRARPISGNVIDDAGQVDDVEVTAAWRAAALPLVVVDDGGAIAAVRAMAAHLLPHKIVILDHAGGLVDIRGGTVDAINLTEERNVTEMFLAPEQQARLQRYITLMAGFDPGLTLSVTSPRDLARELFTHRGAGTLIRRGETVSAYDRFTDVDTARLERLISDCFGRSLRPDYFTMKQCLSVYVTEHFRGTAIVTQEDDLPPYLDKFAVTQKAQGEGIGGLLWRQLRHGHPQFFWRSRTDNPINSWYFSQATGSCRVGRWVVFWSGIDDFAEIERCVNAARDLPETLADS